MPSTPVKLKDAKKLKSPKVPLMFTFWFRSYKPLSDAAAVLFVPTLVSNEPEIVSFDAFFKIILITAVAAPEPYKVEIGL